MIMHRAPNGYIALVSAIIISAVLLIITFAMSFSVFFVRFNILDSEFKKTSEALAEACVNTAVLELEKSSSWVPAATGTLVTVDGPEKTCKICKVSGAAQKTVTTRAAYKKAHTNLEVKITPGAGFTTINSWMETPTSTAAASCPVP